MRTLGRLISILSVIQISCPFISNWGVLVPEAHHSSAWLTWTKLLVQPECKFCPSNGEICKANNCVLFTTAILRSICRVCVCVCVCVCARSVAQSCLTLCNPLDCSPPDSSVLGILQARILEWVVLSSSRGFSWPRDQLHLLYCRILYSWATGGSLFYRVGQSWNSKQSSWNEITKCFMVTSQSQSLCPSLGLFPIHLLPCLPPTFPVQIRCS